MKKGLDSPNFNKIGHIHPTTGHNVTLKRPGKGGEGLGVKKTIKMENEAENVKIKWVLQTKL
ncbi:MAG: hypothetical protein INR73_08840 [Williamsia sp.]|nr:hypothetical protein [Williamsia sp.]